MSDLYARVRELDAEIAYAQTQAKGRGEFRAQWQAEVKTLKAEQQRLVNKIWREEQKRPHPDQPSRGASG